MGNCLRTFFPNSSYSRVYEEKRLQKKENFLGTQMGKLEEQETAEVARIRAAEEQIQVLQTGLKVALETPVREQRPLTVTDKIKATNLNLLLVSKQRMLGLSTRKIESIMSKKIFIEEERSLGGDNFMSENDIVNWKNELRKFDDRAVRASGMSRSDRDKEAFQVAEEIAMQREAASGGTSGANPGAERLASVLKTGFAMDIDAMFEEVSRAAMDRAALTGSAIEIVASSSSVAPTRPSTPRAQLIEDELPEELQ
jgi:hypothetical protein